MRNIYLMLQNLGKSRMKRYLKKTKQTQDIGKK